MPLPYLPEYYCEDAVNPEEWIPVTSTGMTGWGTGMTGWRVDEYVWSFLHPLHVILGRRQHSINLLLANLGLLLICLISANEFIGNGMACSVEKSSAAIEMTPAFEH